MQGPVYVVQNHPIESAGTMVDYLDQKGLPYSVVHTYRGDDLPNSQTVGAALVMGCPTSVSELESHAFLRSLRDFVGDIVNRNVPYLGVCFGGQLLASVLGATVTRHPVREIGMYRSELTVDGRGDSLFAGFPPTFDVFHWHGDTFGIPENATLLATGATCTNQAFRRGNAWGLQFHLETTAADVPLWCDEYVDELTEESKAKADIVSSFGDHAGRLKESNFRLLDNFFASLP